MSINDKPARSDTTGRSYRTCPRCLRIMPETLDCICEPDYMEPKTEPERSKWHIRMLTGELREKDERIRELEAAMRMVRREIDRAVPRQDD